MCLSPQKAFLEMYHFYPHDNSMEKVSFKDDRLGYVTFLKTNKQTIHCESFDRESEAKNVKH